MNTLLKESLRSALDRLTDEEARQILDFIQRVQKRNGASGTLTRLASDPAFRFPVAGFRSFGRIRPISGKGIAATKLLAQDRQ